ncbi:hypothetical protein AC520_1482 [Enterobacter sp. OLF]|nr:hypothetical protein AC520_1482 [Enterobacter sp. OLF]
MIFGLPSTATIIALMIERSSITLSVDLSAYILLVSLELVMDV